MNGSAGVAACHAHGDNFSRPGGLEPISVSPYRAGAHFGPPTVPAFRSQAGGAVTESSCVRRSQVSNSDERPRLETPPLLHYSSVLAKGFIISAFFELFLLSLLLYTLLLRSR